MRVVIELLAGLFWLIGAGLLLTGFMGGISAAYNVQVAVACFLCGIFLLLYLNRNTE